MKNNLLNYSKTHTEQYNQPAMSQWKEYKLGEIAELKEKFEQSNELQIRIKENLLRVGIKILDATIKVK